MRNRHRSHVAAFASLAGVFLGACRENAPPDIAPPSPAAPRPALEFLSASAIGEAATGHPWITHVNVGDLDRDGRSDVLACDAATNSVVWLRHTNAGAFAEHVLASGLAAPVHVEPADMDGDGDIDLLVASMGQVFPNNDPIGAVIALENDGTQNFTTHMLLERVARVTDVRAADFNRDGRLDLAVAQFGYQQGEIRWMECVGPWQFRSHPLLDLSGTINVCVEDMNADGTPDIVALVSQEWEEIHLFANEGAGTFARKIIYGSTNRDFGSSGIRLCDLNQDGRPDILYTNGDGFDYARPGPRPWHGVQWLENAGSGFFRFHRIGALPGAYSPLGVDLDADGDIDVIAVSAFARWDDPQAVSLMWFENDGSLAFTPRVLARQPTHLLTIDVLPDAAGPALITGGFHAYPPYDHISRLTIWRPQ